VTYREETDLTEAPTELLAKLLDVAKAIHRIDKRGRNDFQKYNYVQAVDVVRDVREQLHERGIMVVPGAGSVQHLPYQASKGGAAFLTTLTLLYRLYDVESGQSIEVPWIGVGADTGGDKGVYKAYTGGLKYALLSLFLIPTTDDPERDQLTDPTPELTVHSDNARPAAPRIPVDRAKSILAHALKVGMATVDLEAEPGTPPEFHAVLKAKLAMIGAKKIGTLNVDQAEELEAFLRDEETPDA
jgi:hypothetical protein